MTQTRHDWDRLEEIFRAAIRRPEDERAAFVADACGDDSSLRAELESLLAHEEKAPPDFLESPRPSGDAHRVIDDSDPDPLGLIGRNVGGFAVKRLIAVGGMGVVYLAEQDRPRREVALKVMRRGVASGSALRRFEYESEILGRLRHPHIAQIHAVGTFKPTSGDDRPGGVTGAMQYFAMEYVPDAASITHYADRNRLDVRRRIELFAQVCEAVHHGHTRSVIHRDLKPANILVDATGTVKVIDFGIARATDSDVAVTTQTAVGSLVGTIQYMSPEQCAADPHDIDTRSDVYSLGVVLYELLCGQPPYDLTDSAIHVAARRICEWAPIRSSQVKPRLGRDPECILLKALQKDREERYQTAAGLCRDVRRYLAGEPTEARPATAWTGVLRPLGGATPPQGDGRRLPRHRRPHADRDRAVSLVVQLPAVRDRA